MNHEASGIVVTRSSHRPIGKGPAEDLRENEKVRHTYLGISE
ncbi:MAG TPA: hypothetical protein VJN41_07650 [Alphaproteobacteria bacterium]|nr:hypothetical protein [Alphaproteobacteria bacterium]